MLDNRLSGFAITGYCLWVGAGVPIHLARAGGRSLAGWNDLTSTLEDAAGLPHGGDTFPARLGRAQGALAEPAFKKIVRKNVYRDLCEALLAAAFSAVQKDPSDPVPPEVRQLARLGMSANPIVNFNLEHVTSAILGSGGGGGSIHDFDPRGFVDFPKTRAGDLPGEPRFHRSIYHPHGTITLNGHCVLTESEYTHLQGTLAFQLACHAAFDKSLLIVGMSLNDDYLRDHLQRFRRYIPYVGWICAATPPAEQLEWARKTGVEILTIGSWGDFWQSVGCSLPPENDATVARCGSR